MTSTATADETEAALAEIESTAGVDAAEPAPAATVAPAAAAAAPAAQISFAEHWAQTATVLDAALRGLRPDTTWMARLVAVHDRLGRIESTRLDASLYHLIYLAGHSTSSYSAYHGLLCMLVARETARTLGWDAAEVKSLELAALTMNVSMLPMQDLLAARNPVITPGMRLDIDAHPRLSAVQLAAAGVTDATWLEIVRLHHDASLESQPLLAMAPAARCARLLRRVDIFTAKLSRRAARIPMSPVQAAREACLGADGVPDEIGGALLKSVGLYPPGSFVALAGGELGIVIARGERAHAPRVAVLTTAGGAPLPQPLLRDTLEPGQAVKGAVSVSRVKVVPPHEQLVAGVVDPA